MTEAYTTPTDRQDMRGQIMRMYFETVDAAAELENWMLSTDGYRAGSFKTKFTPFHNAFLKLYFCTRHIVKADTTNELRDRIETWVSRSKGSIDNPTCTRDNLIEVGLDLFDIWTKTLFEQTILEF